MEIERRWLYLGKPENMKELFDNSLMQEVAYLYNPKSLTTCRFRKIKNIDGYNCKIAVKTGRGLKRIEIEHNISAEEFNALTANMYIMKIRYVNKTAPDGKNVLEYKQIDDDIILEIEFNSEKEANSFDLNTVLNSSEWKEVTDNSSYNVIKYYINRTSDLRSRISEDDLK